MQNRCNFCAAEILLFGEIRSHLEAGVNWGTQPGYCTLAVCTPNHQGIRLEQGDWIAGFLTKARSYRLVYAMQVDERVHLNDYFHSPRFKDEKPNLKGDWKQRCGDNFYSQTVDGVDEAPKPIPHRRGIPREGYAPTIRFCGHALLVLRRERHLTPE
jgi:Nucleotide modification associated domain 2